MAGFTNWDFAFIDELLQIGYSSRGGRNGYIIAGDMVIRTRSNVSVGFGGWYNKVADRVTRSPFVTSVDVTYTRSFSSLYGNVFYKRVGVQAGVVPVRGELGIGVPGYANDPDRETDADVFAVGRLGGDTRESRWGSTAGVGVYVHGPRASYTSFGGPLIPAVPSASAFTVFGNASLRVVRGFTIDASYWFVATSHYEFGIRYNRQSRFTVGIGYNRSLR